MAECRILYNLKTEVWKFFSISSLLFCGFRYFSRSVLIFLILFLVSLYMVFGKHWGGNSQCENVATLQVCNHTREYSIPSSCQYQDTQVTDYQCDIDKWGISYSTAFFPECASENITQNLFYLRCGKSNFFYYFCALCAVGVEVFLMRKFL